MEYTIPKNQMVPVECTNTNCDGNKAIFSMIVRDASDPICCNFNGSKCPYCGCYSLRNYNGEE